MSLAKGFLGWRYRVLLLLSVLIVLSPLFLSRSVNAVQLTSRSIEVSSATPSVVTAHLFRFTYASTSTLGSVAFEYCNNSPLPAISCNAPPGLSVLSATINSQSGNVGFSVDSGSSTANRLVLTRTAAAALAVPSTYAFGNITNPSTGGVTEFVRISTYASTNGSGPATDEGSVAFSMIDPFNVGASVPPFLQICVAIIVAPDCSTTSGDSINLGTLLTSQVKSGTSQFSVGTNSINGYSVFVQGTTMTSGNNTITALSSPTPSFPGNNQFGINLRDNSNPDVGADPFGSGSGTPTASYNSPNLFKYTSGEAIAQSSQPSDYSRMTVSYIVNISSSQPPGIYASTFTYLAIATF